jgi:hypothetical protein
MFYSVNTVEATKVCILTKSKIHSLLILQVPLCAHSVYKVSVLPYTLSTGKVIIRIFQFDYSDIPRIVSVRSM